MLWTGTASSAVDLNPTGFSASEAAGIEANQQVGFGLPTGGGNYHALLWTGTAGSAIDLNPNGFTSSQALATNGTEQVGYGTPATGSGQALLWTGTPGSAVDLGSLLPGSTAITSQALAIDGDGNVFGFADEANTIYAVEWSPAPVPEPAVLPLLGLTSLTALRRSRR